MTSHKLRALSWENLRRVIFANYTVPDPVNGATNSQARLRLFGAQETDVKVVLFRDHHAWCPYCQKIWLFLEEKQIPYKIEKITMFCYGNKESWYTKYVTPRGMLPAIMFIDEKRIVTESDDILAALEERFGSLGPKSMFDPEVIENRKLERHLFRAWCEWLCYPARNSQEEKKKQEMFSQVASMLEKRLKKHGGPFFLGKDLTMSDTILTPYVERMNASLFYYKDYDLRKSHPVLGQWFDAMERRDTYRGTQSDFHTHAHDLPPQMGGCYFTFGEKYTKSANLVDNGPWKEVDSEVNFEARPYNDGEPELEAAYRVFKHWESIKKVNPVGGDVFEFAIRHVLTNMLENFIQEEKSFEELDRLPGKSDVALRYVKDRISVPRDMSIWAAKVLRQALENAASQCTSNKPSPAIPRDHRRDQNPVPFVGDTEKTPKIFSKG